MSSLDQLRIPEHKKRYILDKLNPLLEEMVTEVLTTLPSDPVDFMLTWLKSNKLPKQNANDQELAKLRAEIAELKSHAPVQSSPLSDAAHDEEEEEEEHEDEAEDIPETHKAKAGGKSQKVRGAVSAEAYGQWNQKKAFTPPKYEKTEDQKKRIKAVLAKSFMFAALEPSDLNIVIDAMKEVKLQPKERVIRQGDDGSFLFIIEEGNLDVYKKFPGADQEKMVKSCEPGDVFGELALLYNCPRAASVEARDKCVLWQLDRDTFNGCVKDAAAKKREKYEMFLSKVPLLQGIDSYERSQIADALKAEPAVKNTDVIKQGEPGQAFYILEEGTAAAFKNDTKVMDYKAGDYFGELALLKDEPRAASVRITSDSAKLLVLDRRSFKRLLGPLQDLLKKTASQYK